VYISPGYVAFGVGCFVGAYWGHAWGYWDWGHHRVYVNDRHNININRGNINVSNMRTTPWMHDPGHRSARGFARSSGSAPSGLGRSSGGTMGSSSGGRGPNQDRTVNPGAVSVPRAATGRSGAPGTSTYHSQYRGSINSTPNSSVSTPSGVTSRNMDAFRGIGQGSEVLHQSSWRSTTRPSVHSSGWMSGAWGTGGGVRSDGSFGGIFGGSGGHGFQGGHR
jgi:hypothetical protein